MDKGILMKEKRTWCSSLAEKDVHWVFQHSRTDGLPCDCCLYRGYLFIIKERFFSPLQVMDPNKVSPVLRIGSQMES